MAAGKNGTTCTYICFPYKPSIWLCCSDWHLARGRITTQKKCVCHWHDWDGKRRWLARLLSPGDGGTTGITWNSTLQKKKKPRWWKRERERRGRVKEKKTQRTGVHSVETVVLRQGRFPCWYVLRLDLEVLNTCLFFLFTWNRCWHNLSSRSSYSFFIVVSRCGFRNWCNLCWWCCLKDLWVHYLWQAQIADTN